MNNLNLTNRIKLYFSLPKGHIINDPDLLNFICKVFDVCDAYISNKALKHIVESRKFKDRKSVESIILTIRHISKNLIDPDIVFINEKKFNSIGLVKKISNNETANSVVILEYLIEFNHYEIITTYERNDKDIHKLINIKHLIK